VVAEPHLPYQARRRVVVSNTAQQGAMLALTRRATYLDELACRIAALAEPGAGMGPDDLKLYRLYALLARAKGEATTLEDVHDAWSIWQADIRPDHKSLVPFARLHPEVQALDAPYRDAIHAAARELREGQPPQTLVVDLTTEPQGRWHELRLDPAISREFIDLVAAGARARGINVTVRLDDRKPEWEGQD
jgi:hypothetical protein